MRLERCARCRDIQPLGAAEEIIGIEIAAHEVGIGDRGPSAAASIARRAGIGAGAFGPDSDPAHAVDVHQAAAAGTDLHHLDDGNAEG